ncbi:MAG: TPM domain-containing protein [Bacteroidota bacterium]
MDEIESFLSADDEQEIIDSIRIAEKNTSGEIRIHIENSSKLSSIDRAKEVFHYLKMGNTKLQNGVLIYLAVEDHEFAIYGDQGINSKVKSDFWENTKDIMQDHFRNSDFKKGLIEGVKDIGKQLETYFPWHDSDVNELTNEISKG